MKAKNQVEKKIDDGEIHENLIVEDSLAPNKSTAVGKCENSSGILT